jgi:hypothetical protein
MRDQDPKAFPDPDDRGAKVEGFGRVAGNPCPSRPGRGAVVPVDPAPDAGAAKPDVTSCRRTANIL